MIKSGSSRHSTIIHHLNLLLLLMLPWLFGILSHHHSKISSNHVAAVNAAGFMNHARHAQHHNLRKHEDYDVSQTRNKHHIPLFFASSSSAAATIYPEDHVDDNKASLIAWTTATTQRHSRPFSYLTRLLLAGRPRKPASSSDPEFDLVSNNNNKDDDDDDDDDDDEFDTDDQDVSSSSSSLYFVPEAQVAERANQLAALLSSPSTNGISNIALDQELSNSFLQYALSIILGRALPDARDGLKPVHRRILYSMHQLHLLPTTSHRKCARVVGEVLGKFHPHGDVAVYDALVRLAQTFSTHYPLIDGHGNFGSIDADPAAAMRYTECRLSSIAQQGLLDELEYDTVDFIPNFDGNEMEPTVLPAKLPILLLNGCAGIAVGMATNVPPHNLGELMRACIALVDGHMQNTTLSDEALLTLVPAPDFPTGASILGKDGARQLYTTGHGGIVMRAITVLEKTVGKQSSKTTTTSRSAIVVTELPYQVNKAALLEKIADLVNDKKLEGIADLRDESDRDGIRMVIELKRDAVPAVVLNNLYKKTSLQTVFSGNFLALMSSNNNSSGTASNVIGPQRFTLRQALETFLQFRFDTIRRKSKFQYTKVTSRAHLVNGLLTALESVDDIIQLIKTAPDVATAREQLGLQYQLSPEQAEAVLKLQLGQLTRLNKNKLQNERDDLTKSAQQLDQLLQVDDAVRNLMKDEFQEMIQKFGTERKTVINMGENGEVAEMDLIKNSRSGM
jgi:DNA gyrase subunit A